MAKKEVKISALGTLVREVKDNDIIPIVADNKTYQVAVKEILRSVNVKLADKEDDLGKPLADGYVLSSDIVGNRSWVLQTGGEGTGDGNLLKDDNGGFYVKGNLSSFNLVDSAVALAYDGNSSGSTGMVEATGAGAVVIGYVNSNNNYNSTGYLKATGDGSFAMGYSSGDITSSGYGSFAGGYTTHHGYDTTSVISSGYGSFAFGGSNTSISLRASGDYSVAMGHSAVAEGQASISLGYGTKSDKLGAVALGKYNVGTADNILEVGIGTSSSRSNAFEIHLSSEVVAPGMTTTSIDNESTGRVLTTREWVQDAMAGGTGGELIFDAPGYRINGLSTGQAGVESVNIGSDDGGEGEGRGTASAASGYYSTVMGRGNNASGPSSTATGKKTTASGENSFSGGYYTTSAGASSVSIGMFSSASGNSSVALGYNTMASGHYSSALGKRVIALNESQFVTGRYNGVGDSAVNTDSIFEVGIGSSNVARKNAFEIYSDGRVVVPGLSTAIIDSEGTGKVLTTREWVQANVGGAGGELVLDGAGYRINGRTSDTLGVKSLNLGFDGSNTPGVYAVALGRETSGTANYTTATGIGTIAAAPYSLVTGIFNIGKTDTLVEVGTGLSAASRENVFEVFKDGRVVAPKLTSALISDPKSLVTKEYLFSAEFGNSLPTSAGTTGQLWNNGGVVSVS